jgi:hypothetical protein
LGAFCKRADTPLCSFHPEVVRQIHNNGFGGATNYNPLEGDIAGWINLLVRNPWRDIEEVPRLQRGVELASLAPPDERRATENIGDRVLLSVMVDSRTGSRFDQE